MNKNGCENVGKSLSGKCGQKFLDQAEKSVTDALKTALKRQFKKQQKQLVIWLVIQALIKWQKSQDLHHRVIHRQLQMKQKILD